MGLGHLDEVAEHRVEAHLEGADAGRGALARLELEGAIKSNYSIRESATGAPDDAPFDRIIVSAAPTSIPSFLVEQLAVGGVMILPVGVDEQWLYRVEKTAVGIRKERLLPVVFVRMV